MLPTKLIANKFHNTKKCRLRTVGPHRRGCADGFEDGKWFQI